MHKKFLSYLLFFAVCLSCSGALAQSCSSCVGVTTFPVDLSTNPDTSWTISSTRLGQCCQGSGSDKCIVFNVTVSPKASEIRFIYKNGTANNGSYEINCDSSTNQSPGNSQCLGGLSSFCITYCNPGGSNDAYTITTSSGFTAGQDLTLRSGCTGKLTVSGLLESSLTWTSVYPGAAGAYNSYLSCTTSCDTTNITPGAGAPAYVDYKVCGSRTGCTSGTYCDTQRVYMVTPLTVAINPSNPVVCIGDPNPTLTATATGGSTPYTYSWNTGATTSSISAGAGSYTVNVSDASSCSAGSASATVTSQLAATANAGVDVSICSGSSCLLAGVIGGSAVSSTWTTSGTGAFDNAALLAATYTPSASDISSGSVTLTLTTSGPCSAVSDQLSLTINAIPTVNAGADASVCAGSSYTLAGSRGGGATSSTWLSSGTGTFDDASLTAATYTPSLLDILTGTVILTLITNDPAGPCIAASDAMILTINTSATVNAGADAEICSGSTYSLSGSRGGSATSSSWATSGSGSFNDATSLTPIYTPSGADISAGIITLTITTNDPAGACPAVADIMELTIDPAATVSAGIDGSVCAGNQYTVSGVLGGSASSSSWSTSGTGVFNNALLLSAIYTPSPADIASGSVILTITTDDPLGPCPAASDAMTLTITPAPTANAGSDQTVCANNANTILNGSVTVASGGAWTTSGSGTFSPDNTTLNATYTPSAADNTSGTITLTLTTTGNGTCTAVSDAMTLTITPAPTANAGSDQTVCANNANATLNGSITIATGGAWTTSGSGTFSPNNTTLNATYIPSAADKTSGTVTLTLTTTGNGTCNTVSDDLFLTITSSPTADAGSDQSVCANNAIATLNGSVTVATGGTWTTSGSGTFSPNTTTLNATYIPSAADKTSGTVTLTLTSTGNGTCSAVSDAMSLTITPAPTANAGSDQSVCANNANVTLNGSVTVASGGAWSSSGSGTFSPNNTTLNATYIPSAGDKTSGTIILTLITTGNGTCTAVSDNFNLTITTASTADAGSDQTVCANNANATLNGSVTIATGGAWSTSGSGIFSPNNTTLNATYIPSAADKTSGTVTLTLITTGNGTCNTVSDDLFLTITSSPTADAGSDQTVCANNATATLNGSVTVATGGTWTTSGSGTFSPNTTTLNATYIPSAADKTSGTVTLTLTTTGNGTCSAVSDAMTLTITPAPTANAGSDQSICTGGSVTLNGAVTIASGGIWTGGLGTFNPGNTTANAIYTPSAGEQSAGAVTLTYTSTGNGTCIAVSDNVTITITGTISINAGTDQTVCANNANTLLNGVVSGGTTTGQWSTSGTGSFSPGSGTLNATYIPSVADKAAGNINLRLVSTNNGGCTPVSDTLALTITAAPTSNAGSDQTVCANNASVTLNGSVTVASGGIWSSSGSGTFSPDNITLNTTYIPSAADKTSGTVTLTLTTAGNGNCTAVSDAMVVTITAAPTANAGTDRTVCANNANVTLNGSVTVATGGAWSTSGSGTFSPNATTLNATYIPSAADKTSGTVTLTLTTTGNGNCTAVSDDLTLTITSSPTSDAGSDQTVCANNANATLNGSVTIATGGIWTTSGSGTFSPSTTTLNATYIPSAADKTSGTVTLTLTTTGNGTCTAVSDPMTLTITTAPTANAGSDQTVCANNPNVTLNGSVTVATGGIWSSSGSGTFSPDNITLNTTYIPSAVDKTSGTVTLTLTSTGNGNCTAVSDAMVVTITAASTANAGIDRTVCANNASVTLNGSVTVATGGTWSSSGSGTFSPNNTALNATYIPSAADKTSGTVTLTLTTTGNGNCNAVSDDLTLTITSSPTSDAGSDQTVCANNANATLNGSVTVATGGTWSSSGSGTFSPNNTTLNATYIPSAADKTAGTVTLTLITTGNGTCNAVSDAMTLTITPSPTVNAGIDQTVCASSASVVLNGVVTIAVGGSWTGGSGTFTPDNTTLNAGYLPSASEISAGTVTLTLTTTGNGTCLALTDSMKITITSVPVVNAGTDNIVCANNANVSLNGSSSTGSGHWVSSGTGAFSPNSNTLNASYIPSASDKLSGSIFISLASTNNGGCTAGSDTLEVTITPAPTVNAGSDQGVCANNANVILNGSVTVATGGIWSTSGSGSFSPDNITINPTYIPSSADKTSGTVTLTLTTTGNGNCIAVSDAMVVTITAAPTADAGTDRTVCANNANVTLNGSVTVASGGEWSTSGSGTFSPGTTTLNATYIPSAADKTSGTVTLTITTTGNGSCIAVSDDLTLTITSSPTSDAGVDQTVCANNATISLNGSVTVATGGIWSTSGSGTFSPNIITLNATYIPSAADKALGTVILTLTTTGNGTCSSVSDAMTLTITPGPIANAGNDQSVCANNANVSLNGSVNVATGGMWSTSGSGTFAPDDTTLNSIYSPGSSDTAAGSVTIYLTTTGNSNCNASVDSMTIVYTSAPTVNAGNDAVVCLATPDHTLNGSSTTGAGVWTTTGSGIFSPVATVLNAIYTPGNSDTAAGSVTLILTSTNNGGCNAVSDTMDISYTEIPSVSAGSDQTVCANNAVVIMNGISSTGTGIWTTNGDGIFFPDSTTVNATYTAGDGDTATGSVMLTFTSTGGCIPVSQNITLTITDAPLVQAGPDPSICLNNPVILLSGMIGGITTSGRWSTSGSGSFTPDDSTLNATYIPDSSDLAAGSVTLVLTSTGNGDCLPVSDTALITFTSSPYVQAGADIYICDGSMTTQLNGNVMAGASTGQWTTSGTGTFVPNANTLNAVYHLSAADTANGIVTLVLTSSNNGNCIAETDTLQIHIADPPVTFSGIDVSVCANNADVILNGVVTSSSGTGLWISTGSGIFLPADTALNALYEPSPSDLASGNVTLILTATQACIPSPDSMLVTFTPAPLANAGSDIFICSGTMTATLSGSVSGGASQGRWSTSGTGSFIPDDSTLLAAYQLSTADSSAGSIVLTLVTTDNGNCFQASDTVTITITSVASADAGNDTLVCADSPGIPLNGTISGGLGRGQWSTMGSGAFSPNDTALQATYIPSAADAVSGNVVIILSSTYSCLVSMDTLVITFIPVPATNAGSDTLICSGDSLSLSGQLFNAAGAKWITDGSGSFTPDDSSLNAQYVPSVSDISAGNISIILTSTGNGNCIASSDTLQLTIATAPIAFAGNDTAACTNVTGIQLNGSVTGSGTSFWTTSGSGIFVPDAGTLNAVYQPGVSDTEGVHLVLAVTNDCGVSVDSMAIIFDAVPVADAGIDQTVCGSDSAQLSGVITGSASGVWTTTGTGQFIPNDTTLDAVYIPGASDFSAGSTMILLITNGINLCSPDIDTLQLTYISEPVVFAGSDTSVCNGIVQLNGTSTGGTYSWSTSGSGSFPSGNSILNATYQPAPGDTVTRSVVFILTTSNTCFTSVDSVVVSLLSIPAANAGTDQTICAGSSVNLNGLALNASTLNWTSYGSGSFTPNDSDLNAVYHPGAADILAGSVTLQLSVSNACANISDTIHITIDPGATAQAGSDQIVCEGMPIFLSGTFSGSSGIWITTGSGTFLPNDTVLNVDYIPGPADISAGTVSIVLAATGGNCGSATDTLNIILNSKPLADFVKSTSCVNGATDFTDTSSIANGIISSWSWNFGSDSTTLQNASYTYATTGTQPVILIVSSGDGCSDTVVKNITINPEPEPAFVSQTFCPDTARFTDNSSITSGAIIAWSWSFGDLTFSNEQNPMHEYPSPGHYQVELTIVSDSGCTAMLSDTVILNPCTDHTFLAPVLPTAFTPNNDRHNDVLFVRGGPFSEFDFRIYNEWGNEIFRTNTQTIGWDGTYNGKLQPGGKYIWTVNGRSQYNDMMKLTGQVILIR